MRIFLEIKQIKEMLDLARANPRDLALFHLAFSTGLRISDLLSLERTEMLDADGQIMRNLRLKMKKTKQWIERPLRNDCRESIFDYLTGREDQSKYLFPGTRTNQYEPRDAPMNRSSAHRIYKKYLRKMFPASMIVGASTHTLRRSAAKIVSKRTGRIEPAAHFLGHKNIASTMAYIDMSDWGTKADEAVLSIDI